MPPRCTSWQIGRRLQSDGHSVRLATHLTLRPVVEKGGLDFYSLGGDPEALCDYLCRNQVGTYNLGC